MHKTFYTSVCRWLLRFITFQLFISLMSLPLLIAWGLPLSVLSPFGNGLFNPLLTFFLMLSTLIFITELIFLPNQWLCWRLEKTNMLFIATSRYADSSWLIGVRQLPLPLLCTIPLIGLWIIFTPQLDKPGLRALALAGTLTVIFMSAYLTNSSYLETYTYGKRNKSTIIAYADHSLVIFDFGALNTSFRYRSWWDYTLMSEITKKTGKTTIDYLVCLDPSEKTLEGLTKVTDSTLIRHIIIVATPTKHGFLQEGLKSLISSLATKKISCTVQTLEKSEQPVSVYNKTSKTPEKITFSLPNSCIPNKVVSETYQLTEKTRYTPYTSLLSRTSHIIGATIVCDNQVLTIGAQAELGGLSTPNQILDKHSHAL